MKIKFKVLLIIICAFFITVLGVIKLFEPHLPNNNKIIAASAINKDMFQTVYYIGTIEPNDKQEIYLNKDQKIDKIYIKLGQTVKKGDLLLSIDEADYINEMDIANINLDSAEKELKRILGKKQNIKNNSKQSEEDIKILNARMQYDSAKSKLEQNKKLYEMEVISKKEYEDSEKNLAELENNLKLAKIEKENAEYQLESQIEDLKKDIEIYKANIRNKKAEFEFMTKSEIDGQVVKMDVRANGSTYNEGPHIIIHDLSKYLIKAKLKQRHALHIKEGDAVEIKLDGVSNVYKGTIYKIGKIAEKNDNGEAQVEVAIAIDNPDSNVKIGYTAEIKINSLLKANSTAIDFEGLIQDRDGKSYVYFIDGDIARKKEIKTGIKTDFYIEVLEGLIAGDKYVISPPEKMRKKDRVKIWGYDTR